MNLLGCFLPGPGLITAMATSGPSQAMLACWSDILIHCRTGDFTLRVILTGILVRYIYTPL